MTDIFLRLDTIGGEVVAPQFKGQIEVASVSAGVYIPPMSGSSLAGSAVYPAAHQPVITKPVDSASVNLMQAFLTGTRLTNGVISFWDPVSALVYLTIKLDYLYVSGIESVISGTDDRPHEKVTLAVPRIYWTYLRKNPDGTTSKTAFGWDFTLARPI
jgi:type VI protein secretion system component Hcp